MIKSRALIVFDCIIKHLSYGIVVNLALVLYSSFNARANPCLLCLVILKAVIKHIIIIIIIIIIF